MRDDTETREGFEEDQGLGSGSDAAGDGDAGTSTEATSEAPAETVAEEEGKEEAGVATAAENADLEHTEGGVTTRDGTDGGVPMAQGSGSEPVGPEDALGEGQKRGDYSERVGPGHMESRAVEGGGEPVYDDEGNVIDYKPRSELVSQSARVGEQGDVEGEKGGVTTSA
jgi:hypothetical protein